MSTKDESTKPGTAAAAAASHLVRPAEDVCIILLEAAHAGEA
jgi:hypothetical protein